MNYAIVGTDLSGKTTLVNMLSNVLDFEVVKGSSFELAKCTNEELFNTFVEFSKLDNTVFDRFLYCNEVYAPMYDDFAMLTYEQRRQIELEFDGNLTIIYLYADDENLEQRFSIRGDDYVTIDKIKYAKTKYDESLIKVEFVPVIRFNTGELSTYEIVEQILLHY